METIELKELFSRTNYDWEKDKESIDLICKITKTRVQVPAPSTALVRGCEQTFLVKAITDYIKPKNVLEIGTGRGTAAYAMALSPSVRFVSTVDIIPFKSRSLQSVDFRPRIVSNEDLYEMIPYAEKLKIAFILRQSYTYDNKFDLAFIDGCHTDKSIIEEDFKMCSHVLDNDGVILWDDYEPNYPVKEVVDSIKNVNTTLVEFRGHLFGEPKEKSVGIAIMAKINIWNNIILK